MSEFPTARRNVVRDWLRTPTPVPAEDFGFFGPDSVTWKVWSYPTSLTIGFQRAVVIEELDPALVAAVDKTHDIYKRPRTRYDRTLRYFAMVAFDAGAATARAADVLVKVHSKAIGEDPVTGRHYDANDPQSQLWIHLTAWHSILIAYERYGPGRLTAAEESQYWAECARAAELQTCDPTDVPRSRAGVRAYFASMRPELIGSDIARQAMNHLLCAEVMLPPMPAALRPGALLFAAVLRRGTLATMPRWMREMSGLYGSPALERVLDAGVRLPLRVSYAVLDRSARLKLMALKVLSPSTVDVVARVLLGIPPVHPTTTTPRAAQARLGYAVPREAHLALRAKQRDRVFGAGLDPSDEGLIESQPILGSVG